jgi:hypothetical protein
MAELRAATGVDPVADGKDGIQVEVFDLARDHASAFILNCCKKCNSCAAIQFTFGENLAQMPGDDGPIALEQGSDLVKTQPKSLSRQAHVQRRRAVRRLVDHNFAAIIGVHPIGRWLRCVVHRSAPA